MTGLALYLLSCFASSTSCGIRVPYFEADFPPRGCIVLRKKNDGGRDVRLSCASHRMNEVKDCQKGKILHSGLCIDQAKGLSH